ncbi:uncharacterized protein At4g37920 isoform X2 [Ziziphus jujuba]|uniref:Uncharacterized protein At4g37920 isoform X2 n=2 Tax=Ziziphus jujuba TaxID=326968 RepID=A0A6P4ANQ4_ZIZJJ|nr:uncharacterized protein At4g37920 isoform X2 [Ziziphus jujuba]KAH7520387.1 hypothetical protein FEM48_Zijuj08G0138500 [Ziziphus jujuba var. spinosa]
MNNFLGLKLSSSITKPSLFNTITFFPFVDNLFLRIPPISSTSLLPPSKQSLNSKRKGRRISPFFKVCNAHSSTLTRPEASNLATAQVEEEQVEVEVAEGYTITQFCDKMIDVFLNEKPKSREWRKFLVFREEWQKYRESFYNRCRRRADSETEATMKQKLISLGRKVKKIDDEMERHSELLKEIQDSPTDINAVVARRREDFTGEFFRHLTLLAETFDSLEDRDAIARLGARCLSAVSAYDNTLETVETFNAAQAKFDDILNSPSMDVACEKIKSLAKAKELDSSLVLLINSAWASAKQSTTMKNEVKDIMYRLYTTTKSSLRSISPKEVKLLKHLLNITDPEERFSALATAFSPGNEHEAKDPNGLYTTPKELHKWIKIMLDAYHLNKEDTDIREAREMIEPVVIQRLFILKETIEEEYLDQRKPQKSQTEEDPKGSYI